MKPPRQLPAILIVFALLGWLRLSAQPLPVPVTPDDPPDLQAPGDSLPPATFIRPGTEPSPGIQFGNGGGSPDRLPSNLEELLQQNPGLFPEGLSGGNLFNNSGDGAPLAEQEATVQKAVADLQNPDREIRRSACMILGKYNLPAARVGLFTAIKDTDAVVRRTALVAILENRPQLSGREALEVLPMIADPDVHNRRLASSTTQMMMLSSPMQLRPGTHTPVRVFPPELAAKLKGALLDSDLTVRRNMVASLVNLRLDLDDETIAKLLGDSDREIRLSTMTALAQLRPTAIIKLGSMLVDDREPLVREELVKQLSRLRSGASKDLLEKLAQDKELKVSVFARLSLLDLDPTLEAYRKLLPILNEPGISSEIVRPLIYSAPMLPPADAVAVMKEVLKTRSPVYTADALTVYSTVIAAEGAPDLGPVLPFVDDGLPAIRQAAMGVLMRAPRALTEKDIMNLTTSQYADVRQQAVFLARLLPTSQAVEVAMELLLDDKVEVRVAALRELVSRQAPNWLTITTQSLKDDNREMAEAALEILGAVPPSALTLKALQEFVAQNPQHPLTQQAQILLEQQRRDVSTIQAN